MNGHDPRFEHLDGAYVLGALGPDERRAYEDHLLGCPQCRAEVAELTALPGLLSRLDTQRALELLAEPAAAADLTSGSATISTPGASGARAIPATAPDLATRLYRQSRHRRVRTRLSVVGAALVAAAVAVAVMLGIQSVRPTPTLTTELAPTAALANSTELTASVRLYAKAWGTEVDTECRHHEVVGGDQYATVRYGLYVVGSDGSRSLVSSWRGIAKSPIETTAATSTPISQMSRLELRSMSDNQVLLAAPVRG